MNYNDLTRRHFESAANAGVLSGLDTLRGAAGSLSIGTWVQFDIELEPQLEPRRESHGAVRSILAVRFLAFGCPHVIAAADWIALRAVGSEALPSLPETVAALRERFAMPIEKLGRLLIIEDAWIAALSPPYPSAAA